MLNYISLIIEAANGTRPRDEWRRPAPDVGELKARILEILDREGLACLALNGALYAADKSDRIAALPVQFRDENANQTIWSFAALKSITVALTPIPVADIVAGGLMDATTVPREIRKPAPFLVDPTAVEPAAELRRQAIRHAERDRHRPVSLRPDNRRGCMRNATRRYYTLVEDVRDDSMWYRLPGRPKVPGSAEDLKGKLAQLITITSIHSASCSPENVVVSQSTPPLPISPWGLPGRSRTTLSDERVVN